MRNQFTQLWRLRIPMLCCLKDGDPRLLMVEIPVQGWKTQLNSDAQKERERADGWGQTTCVWFFLHHLLTACLSVLVYTMGTLLLFCCLVAKLCPSLCDPMDSSPPGSSVRGIFQARILEWVAISFSRGSSWPRDWTVVLLHPRWILYRWAIR